MGKRLLLSIGSVVRDYGGRVWIRNEYPYRNSDEGMLSSAVSSVCVDSRVAGMSSNTVEDQLTVLLCDASTAQDTGHGVAFCCENHLKYVQFQEPPGFYSVAPTLSSRNTADVVKQVIEIPSYATADIPDTSTRNFPLRTFPVGEVKEIPKFYSLSTLPQIHSIYEMNSTIVEPLQNSHCLAEMEFPKWIDEEVQSLYHQMEDMQRPGADATSGLEQIESAIKGNGGLEKIARSIVAAHQPGQRLSEQPEKWDVAMMLSSWDDEASSDQLLHPTLTVTNEPPEYYRPRYEKEAMANPKGYMRNERKEPVVVKLQGVQPSGDLILTISVVTSSGTPHPTIYPTCFGKTMPLDWTENMENRTVMTVVREDEGYEKRLKYLGVRRTTLKSSDLGHVKKGDLTNFRVRFQIDVPTKGEFQPAVAETRHIRAVCPGTMTKLRRKRGADLETAAQLGLAKCGKQY